MYSVLLVATLGFGFGVLTARRDGKAPTIIKYAIVVFCTFFGTFVGCLLAEWMGNFVSYHNVEHHNGTLVSMRNTQGLQGTFVIGTFGMSGHGELKNTHQYNFLLRMEDGSMVPHSLTADTLVHLFEDEAQEEVGSWSTTYNEPNPASVFYNWAFVYESDRKIVRQDFRLPRGSVVQSFEIR